MKDSKKEVLFSLERQIRSLDKIIDENFIDLHTRHFHFLNNDIAIYYKKLIDQYKYFCKEQNKDDKVRQMLSFKKMSKLKGW
jgi:hypothetical protein